MESKNRFSDVWEAVAKTPEEAKEWRKNDEMMDKIIDTIQVNKWSRKKASQQCGVSLEQIDYLLKNRLSKFSTNDLITILENLKRNTEEQRNTKTNLGFMPTLQPA